MIRVIFRPAASWLRIGPAWAVLAGALILPLGEWDVTVLLRVLTALLLADPIWGAFWQVRRAAVPVDLESTYPVTTHRPIPYAMPGSPVMRLATWLRDESNSPGPSPAWHSVAGWPVALLFAWLLALSLGTTALVLTGIAVGLSLLRLVWIRHAQPPPAVLDAGLVVGLPWLMGMAVVGGLPLPGVAQATAFGLLVWGVLRAEQGLPHARTIIIIGQAVVLAVLVWCGQPLAAGLVGTCFLVPWWLLAWPPGTPAGARALAGAQPWFLVAMLLSVVVRN